MNNAMQNILRITKYLLILPLILIIYLTYFQMTKAEDFSRNSMNLRNNIFQKDIVRGMVYDCENQPLTKNKDDSARFYPKGKSMAHVIGYANVDIGNSGIESYFNSELSGNTQDFKNMGYIGQLFNNGEGNDIVLTIDSELTHTAYDALNEKRGAIVVLDAKTGGVLAMVSTPSFDPNYIENIWTSLNEDPEIPLLNRATNGLYPPGSIIKPMTAELALHNAVTDEHEVFECTGVLDVGNGFSIKEAHDDVHGLLHLKEALVKSCNVTFGTLAIRLGADNLKDGFKRYGFYEPVRGEIFESAPNIPDFKTLDNGDIAQIGIGQSSLLVTPFRMALMASAIANDGILMQPYILEKIVSPSGIVIEEHEKQELKTVMSKERARLLSDWMEEAVVNGTGKAAKVSGIKIAGKTGTAENTGDKEHAWFIGFAEIGERKVAFSILVENGGSGADIAAPIARKLVLSLDR